jgi:hypothetical protein
MAEKLKIDEAARDRLIEVARHIVLGAAGHSKADVLLACLFVADALTVETTVGIDDLVDVLRDINHHRVDALAAKGEP